MVNVGVESGDDGSRRELCLHSNGFFSYVN